MSCGVFPLHLPPQQEIGEDEENGPRNSNHVSL